MNGPSRWMPASSPSSTSSRSTAIWSTSVRTGSDTRLASIVVVPCLRWALIAVTISFASPLENDPPPPPWQCASTKPGTT